MSVACWRLFSRGGLRSVEFVLSDGFPGSAEERDRSWCEGYVRLGPHGVFAHPVRRRRGSFVLVELRAGVWFARAVACVVGVVDARCDRMVGLSMGATDGGSTRLEHTEGKQVVAGTDSGSDSKPGGRHGGALEARAEQEEEVGGEAIVLDSVRVSEEQERCCALAEPVRESGNEDTVKAVLEEDVDISPNGNSLASLAYTPHDVAARFKNMYVYDNSFSVLPASTRIFKQLRKLKYWANEVKMLPDEIGELTELEEVCLKMSPAGLGSLPPLSKLNGLRALELHQAPALPSSATLTRDIAQLRSLTRLSVCHFSIS